MPVWRMTVKLKDLLSGDTSDATVRDVARQLADRLDNLPEVETEWHLSDVVAALRDISGLPTGVLPTGVTLCDCLNETLDDLYDWADDDRVWIA